LSFLKSDRSSVFIKIEEKQYNLDIRSTKQDRPDIKRANKKKGEIRGRSNGGNAINNKSNSDLPQPEQQLRKSHKSHGTKTRGLEPRGRVTGAQTGAFGQEQELLRTSELPPHANLLIFCAIF
jgi:hypothetical protein